MRTKLMLRILLTTVLAMGFCLDSGIVTGQSNPSSAKKHLERAMSYRAAGDPRAEEEYKQAIADRGGAYPQAWEGLSGYLANALRFKEAAAAWRKYLKQTNRSVSPDALEQLKRLDRGASLKSKSDKGQLLTLEEMIELIKLVDGFGSKGDAIPYAEKAVELNQNPEKLWWS